MGTSQSHNLKSSPNWSAAKRAMTSLANGTDNKSESNAKFFGNLGIALGNGLYRGGRIGGHGGKRGGSSFGRAGGHAVRGLATVLNNIKQYGLVSSLGIDRLPDTQKPKTPHDFKELLLHEIIGDNDSTMDDAAATYAMDKVLNDILSDCKDGQEIEDKLQNATDDDLHEWIITFEIEYILEYSAELFQSHIFNIRNIGYMETRININYTPSKTSEVFGLFTLSFQGSDGKVHSVDTKFNPKQLWEFSRDTSSVAFDLLVLSMIVYNVDRAVLRLSNSDDGWKRNLILLNVPVINLEDMNKGREAFNKAINFLTGDNWDIHFIQADSYSYNPTKKVKEYNPQFFEKVALFSGGLDSLIGFIDEASTLSIDKKILLVSHMELGKEHSDQKSILKYCRENNIFSNKYEQVLLNAGLKPHSWNIKTPTESTFRSRSLLFFAAGIYIANKISPQCQLIVPENGTISINIPLDSGRRSSCSTRTTHPTFIKRIQEALYTIGISNSIYNPYRLKSKADMVLECCQDTSKKAILKSLVDLSCSCAKRGHNVFWDKSGIEIRNAKIKHCGMCLPCLYRRVALDTIGLDNEALLGTDVLHGIKFNLDNKHQKRNRDFNALLYFLKNRMNERTIRQELFFNGIIEKQELDEYTSLALHSYRQVINWLKKKATNEIQIRAGI